MNELGALLRKLRGKRSLREIAEISGVSHNYLSIVEKGVDPRTKTPVSPSPETLKKLSEAYNYSYEELMELAGYIPKKINDDDEKNDSDGIKQKYNDTYNKLKEEHGMDQLIREVNLSDEDLLEKYSFTFEGKPMDEELVKKMLVVIRFMSD